jgi:hypothetical protein
VSVAGRGSGHHPPPVWPPSGHALRPSRRSRAA